MHDGIMVNESLAILEYLERQFPNANPLLSSDRKLQARALSLSHETEILAKLNSEVSSRTLFAKEGQYTKEQVQESVKKVWMRAKSHQRFLQGVTSVLQRQVYDELDVWEGHLDENAKQYKGGWLVGDKLSIADLSLYPYIATYTDRLGLKLTPRYQRLDKWNSQVR